MNNNYYKYKYYKYKIKYYNTKYNKLENNELVQYEDDSENSRFDIINKECKHWYALYIVNNIIDYIKLPYKYNILVLGVALGGIIIHLANKFNNINITGVDIIDNDFDTVYKYIDLNKINVKLICQDANIMVKTTTNMYDFIVCDIFNNTSVPEFVLSDDFLNNIYRILNKNGLFLINTIGIDKKILETKFKKISPNLNISITPDPIVNELGLIIDYNMINIISIIKKL